MSANLVTEDEARTKWCPFARALGGNGSTALAAYNRHDIGPGTPNGTDCIASECMAWRWREGPWGEALWGDPEDPAQRRGYCGLVLSTERNT